MFRETGALCAMKEVEIFPDDPKSAECIKQLEQVIHYFLPFDSQMCKTYYAYHIWHLVSPSFVLFLSSYHVGMDPFRCYLDFGTSIKNSMWHCATLSTVIFFAVQDEKAFLFTSDLLVIHNVGSRFV